MKKLFALLLAIVMVISMAACAPAEPAGTTEAPEGTTAAKETTTVAATTTEPAVDLSALPLVEPGSVKLTVGIPSNATVLSYEDNEFTKWIEEQTGVDLEFVFFSSDGTEKAQQLSLMVANQEKLPDIIISVVDEAMASELGQQGLLADLTPYYETSSYHFKNLMSMANEFEANYFWNRARDAATGEIYHFAVPKASDGVDSNEWIGALSTTMGKNVGLDATEVDTIDELYEFLYKTVKEDGNGNGKADEIGLLYNPTGYRSRGDIWVINAYVYCNDEYLFNVTDSEVWVPYNTDEYRQAMITLNKWYAEGLISPLTFSLKDTAEFKSVIDVGAGNYNCPVWVSHPTLVCAADSRIGEDYTNANTLADETGKGGYTAIRDIYQIQKNIVIPANEENPEMVELAFRVSDFLCSHDAIHWARLGPEGTHWEHIDGEAEGLKDFRGNWAGYRIISDEWSKETSVTWHNNPINPTVTGMYAMDGCSFNTALKVESWERNAISYGNLWEKKKRKCPRRSSIPCFTMLKRERLRTST